MTDFKSLNQFGGDSVTPLDYKDAPVFADNAAALAGGLVADQIYKTATGELRIVV